MNPSKSKTIEIRNLTDLRSFVERHRPTIEELCEIIIGGLKYYPHPEDWTSCEDLLDELDHIEEHYLRLEEGVGIRQERPLFLDPGRVRKIREMGKEPRDPFFPEPMRTNTSMTFNFSTSISGTTNSGTTPIRKRKATTKRTRFSKRLDREDIGIHHGHARNNRIRGDQANAWSPH